MKEDKTRLDPCPECAYTEPTKANCQACFDKKYENGEITDDDIREFGNMFLEEINKELGLAEYEEDFDNSLKAAKVYADASYADSDDGGIEALRCAIYHLITCLHIQKTQSSTPKAREEEI